MRHIEAYMDGTALSSVGPVIIQQVYEDAPAMEITEGERPGRAGQRLLAVRRASLRVTIEVAIRELFNLSRRASIMESVAKWAQGEYLELSSRPDRRLRVACVAQPALGAVRDYTSTARIELAAYAVPYWQSKSAHGKTMSGASGSAQLYVPGTAPSPVNLSVSVVSGTLSSFSVTVGGETIALAGLALHAGSTLTFSRDARDDLLIRSGESSLLSARTAQSADDLIVSPGTVPAAYTADTDVSVTFSSVGRWA